jgi:hypothetical protein
VPGFTTKKAATVGLKPDFGLRLIKDGVPLSTDHWLYDFHLFSVAILGDGKYSTTVDRLYDGKWHALSLDFDRAQLDEIVAQADPKIAAVVRDELLRDPITVREIVLDGCVTFAVRARLGSLQIGSREQFVPLLAQEILPAPSIQADINRPILEWEEDVLDAALRGLDRVKNKENGPLDAQDEQSRIRSNSHGRQPRADVIIGPPCSGRSTYAVEPLIKAHGSFLIDAEEAKKLLPEYDNGRGMAAVHTEGARIAGELLLPKIVESNKNIVQPLIGKNLNKIDRLLKSFSEIGYEVHLHLVELPIEKAIRRAIIRYVETGQLFDPLYLESIDHLPRQTFDELKARPYVRSYQAISTDVPFGEPARLIESGGQP